jgi:diguanylate cyclase (GGDEF)-like protein/PAS domain S-box-containing protein
MAMSATLDIKRDDGEYLLSLTVLYADVDDASRGQLEQFLDLRVGRLVVAGNGQEGLHLFQQHRPDIVVAGIAMPVIDGLAMVNAIRKIDPRIPVVIIAAFDEADYLLKAIELGVEAYVLKPVNGTRLEQVLLNCARNHGFEATLKRGLDLLRRVLTSLDEAVFVVDALARHLCDCNPAAEAVFGYSRGEMAGQFADLLQLDWTSLSHEGEQKPGRSVFDMEQRRMRRKDGEVFFAERYAYPVNDSAGRIAYVVIVIRDLSRHRRAEDAVLDKWAQVDFLGYHDPLTGLANQFLFLDRLKHALVQARRRKEAHAVLLLELEGFKSINTLWGYDLGDELLQAVAARLALSVREQDTVARFGGCTFAMLLEEVEGAAAGAQVAKTVLGTLSQPFDLQSHSLNISFNIGLSLSAIDSVDAEMLVKQASLAMERSRKKGGSCFCFFAEEPGWFPV